MKNIILILGNPGTGKSTIVNCLAGKVFFDAGVSYGKGRTFEFNEKEHDGITYMDTPGLADQKLQDAAVKAIKIALTRMGSYKIFFMVRLQNGRVVEEDLVTVQRVMKSINIPNLSFSIIINQVSAKTYSKLVKGESQFDENALFDVLASMNAGDHGTTHVFFMKKIEDLDEETNAIVPLPQEFHTFVAEATPIVINRSEDVSDISTNEQEVQKLREQLAKTTEDMRANHALATKRLQDVIDTQNKAAEDMRAEHKRDAKAMRAEQKKAAEAMKAEFERAAIAAKAQQESAMKVMQAQFDMAAMATKVEHDKAIRDQRELYNQQQQALMKTYLEAARMEANQLKLKYGDGVSVKFIITNSTKFAMKRAEVHIESGKSTEDTYVRFPNTIDANSSQGGFHAKRDASASGSTGHMLYTINGAKVKIMWSQPWSGSFSSSVTVTGKGIKATRNESDGSTATLEVTVEEAL